MVETKKLSLIAFLIGTSAILLSGCASIPAPTTKYSGAMGTVASADPDLLAAQERQFQALQRKIIATSEMVPHVSLTANTASYMSDDLAPVARANTQDYGIGLTWPVLRSIAAFKGVQAAQSNIQAADAAMRAVENKLLVNAVTAIAMYNRVAKVSSIRIKQSSRLISYLSDQQKRYALGKVSNTDLHQIKGRIARENGVRVQAIADKSAAIAQLASYGLTPLHGISLAAPRSHLPASEDVAVAEAYRNNPEKQESNHKVDAAKDNAAQAAYGLLPDLSLDVSASQNTTDYTNYSSSTDNDLSIFLRLSVPLYDGGRKRAKLSEQRSRAREMRYKAKRVGINIERTVRSLWYKFKAAVSAAKYAQSRYKISKRSLVGIRKGIKIGARSVSDGLEGLEEVSESQLSLAYAHFDVIVYGHQLMAQVDSIANAYNLTENISHN